MANSVLAPSTHPSSLQTVLVNVTLRAILVPLNSSMIVVALPVIMRNFNITVRAAGRLATAYLIIMVALQFTAGKLGDRIGGATLYLEVRSILDSLRSLQHVRQILQFCFLHRFNRLLVVRCWRPMLSRWRLKSCLNGLP